MTTKDRDKGSALDLLEREDETLQEDVRLLRENVGYSVEERAEYGRVAKQVIRHVATREAALEDVVRVSAEFPSLGSVSERLRAGSHTCRHLLNRVESMSRGVQGINLNTGQEFHADLEELMNVVNSEAEWELRQGIPALRVALAKDSHTAELKSARHVARHAPMNLNPDGPRWIERAPIVSRFKTIYDHLRDFPRAVSRPQKR